MICEHENSSKGVTAAALEKNPSTRIIILQVPSEQSEREKKNNSNILCLLKK